MLRKPSKDQSSRRPSHHTARTRRANYLIGRCPNTGSTFTTAPCVFPNHRKHLAEGHLVSRGSLRVLPMTPTNASVWSGVAHDAIGLQRNGTRSSSATNLDSILAVITIVFVCGGPVVNASILPSLYNGTPLPQLVWLYGVPLLTIHCHS
ncbi:HTH_Tnp_Tc3_2 domain-containing protein [Trichonephila clavipes]|nr:HTH_Tnp_Tc3_2 domain-containing protein [Trichonephila clavipes]